MNLKELQERINFLVETLPHKNPEDIEVLINIHDLEPTMGARPSVGIKRVYLGFDWEMNQLRIEPEKDLFVIRSLHTSIKKYKLKIRKIDQYITGSGKLRFDKETYKDLLDMLRKDEV